MNVIRFTGVATSKVRRARKRHYPKIAKRCPTRPTIGGDCAMLAVERPKMRSGVGPLLKRHRIFHSCDAEETRAFLGGKDYRFDPTWRRDRQLDARINAVYMPSLYIAYICYGTVSVELTPGQARKDYYPI